MRHLEVHYIQSASDAELAAASGLPDDWLCNRCTEPVGKVPTGFMPFALVLREDDTFHLLCTVCADPVLTRMP